eukprot:GFKZ01012803.1.p1 GENE.GFKZ01012803.1~~GFKZ01012803.1.p1  ORF type:complete len:424 (-),score=18.43 GFKZ01012803.1:195-1466(-)
MVNPPFLALLSALLFLLLIGICIAQASEADPTCNTGIISGNACCSLSCGACGGSGCGQRPGGGGSCCTTPVAGGSRGCDTVGPPCRIGSTGSGDMGGGEARTGGNTTAGVWRNIDEMLNGRPQARHEACFVMARGRGYLIGGRGNRDVSIFNPRARTWRRGPPMPVQMHHMQCVGYRGSVYIPSSWFGSFPSEENNELMWILNTRTLTWRSEPGLPEDRRRGGAAAVVFRNKIYVVAGNRGGHGPPSQSLGWMDYYDLVERRWELNLPSLPDPRDHVGGAMVRGRLCIAGGRNGGMRNFFEAVRSSTWCFNFVLNRWQNVNANLPMPRAGAATGRVCGGRMMIAGGEGGMGDAFSSVHLFNGRTWSRAGDLVRGRHGTGLAVSRCECGQIFIASGSGRRGGSPELDSTEVFSGRGMNRNCTRF